MDAAFAQLSGQLEQTLQEQRTDVTRQLQAMERKLLNYHNSEPLAASPRQAPPSGRGGRNGVGGAGSSEQANGTSSDPPRRSNRRSVRQTAANVISDIVEKVSSAQRACSVRAPAQFSVRL